MSIFGAGPQFWEGVAGFTRRMLSPYVRKMPARVQSVQGTAPNQTAVVARADELAALAAGEIGEIARPAYPVWGSVVVGQQVWCLVDGAGLHVMGTPGGGVNTLAPPERVYKAADFVGYSRAFVAGWQSTVLAAPRIVVPALGQPPAGFAWMMDVTGAIRYRPLVDISSLTSVGFDGVATVIPHGGAPLFAGAQGASGIFHNQIAPPRLGAGFEITFTSWFSVAATVDVNPGPMPAARCYLVAV